MTAYEIGVPSPDPRALDDATGLQVADDLLSASLSDLEPQSHVAQADIGI